MVSDRLRRAGFDWARAPFYPRILMALFTLVWIALAITPSSRHGWALENILVLPIVPILVLTSRRFLFSNLSYTLMSF